MAQAVRAERERCAQMAEHDALHRCVGHANSDEGTCGDDLAEALRREPTV